ncbi:ABC transporter permease [Paenibacillus alkalitolerans]|uniref:ABC transporter permease n=1 Tax=Paenibacillus alkalitolerans TaxID=2799335 RepID=UPI0018F33644|nr:ABC transporter permease [Paenibacillus alkalitolerans]
MSKLWTVIRFTYGNRIKQKSFLITTLIFLLILSVMIHLPSLIAAFSSDGPQKVGVFPSQPDVTPALIKHIASSPDPTIEIVPLNGDEQTAKSMVDSGQLKGYLLSVEAESGSEAAFPAFQYKSKDSMPSGLLRELDTALRTVKQEMAKEEIGLTPEQADTLFAPIELVPVQLTDAKAEGKTESEIELAFVLVYALLFLLYVGVIGYGNLVATEITAEKSSRVMEVLVSSVSPLTQMFGKIIGICLLGLTQIVLFIAVGTVNIANAAGNEMLKELNLNLSQIDPMLLIYFLVFFLLGYLIYATVFAAVGSLVSRTEEVGPVIMPVTMLIIAAFMIAMYGLSNPNAPFVVAMSFIPFFSPLLMFLRIGMSSPAPWEIALSLAILISSVLALGWLAAKIYRTGVLLYGKRPSFRELRKAMRAYDV